MPRKASLVPANEKDVEIIYKEGKKLFPPKAKVTEEIKKKIHKS